VEFDRWVVFDRSVEWMGGWSLMGQCGYLLVEELQFFIISNFVISELVMRVYIYMYKILSCSAEKIKLL